MKTISIFLPLWLMFLVGSGQSQEFYELRVYHVKTDAQEQMVDGFLKNAYIPAMHAAGFNPIGAFKEVEKDTSGITKIYVLVPVSSLDEWHKASRKVASDKKFMENGKDYLAARHDNPPFERLQSILLKAFSHQPRLQKPGLKGPKSERIYELRSYEGHTENILANKVRMFNEGGEVALFKRLGFNAVFYAEVISGPRMPNLMYMTTFENRQSRDEHWKAFGEDPEWNRLKSLPEYQNNVSKIDITFLRPTEYSDY